MYLEYEVTADEYVASQLLYCRLSRDRKRFQWVAYCILTGVLFLGVGWSGRLPDWVALLLLIVGAWWIYVGVMNLYPARYLRQTYRSQELAGKKFKADLNENGFEVTGELGSWRGQWPSVKVEGENERVFILYSQGSVFVFGKQYLSDEQQQELRRLSGLHVPVV